MSLCTWVSTVRYMTAEIISTIERRRNWPTAEKLRIIEEALAPGASIAAVADRNGVCRSLLYTWLRLARTGKMPGISINSPPSASFVPVRIDPPEPSPARRETDADARTAPSPPARGRRRCQVEITLANGRVIKAEEGIDPTVLAELVAVLDGG